MVLNKTISTVKKMCAHFSEWHLIIGGHRNKDFLSEVELFNWKTQKQCFLKDLPFAVGGHSGAVLNEIPIFCGGQKRNNILFSKDCYKYNKESKNWTQVQIHFYFVLLKYC